jgi:GNAT superfamily N-acetyltransferase
MGWRILNKLHEGRTLYIDDLVTAAASRRRGFAQALLALAEDHARRAGCRSVTLDSGHQRFDAHRTYLNAGFRIVSHHFTRDL